jgi:hypothetical protein
LKLESSFTDEYKQQRIAKKVGTEPFESQKRDQINCLKGF